MLAAPLKHLLPRGQWMEFDPIQSQPLAEREEALRADHDGREVLQPEQVQVLWKCSSVEQEFIGQGEPGSIAARTGRSAFRWKTIRVEFAPRKEFQLKQ